MSRHWCQRDKPTVFREELQSYGSQGPGTPDNDGSWDSNAGNQARGLEGQGFDPNRHTVKLPVRTIEHTPQIPSSSQ